MTIQTFTYSGTLPGWYDGNVIYDPTIANASYTANAGLQLNPSGFGFGTPVDGSYVTFMQNASGTSASYTFNGLTGGQTYTLEFYAGLTYANDGAGGGFTVNGTTYGAPPISGWTEDAYTFTATSSSETFTFAPDLAGGHTVGIDNLMLAQGSVEPFNFSGNVPVYGDYVYDPTITDASFSGSAGLELNSAPWGFVTPPDASYVIFLQTLSTPGSASVTFGGLTNGQTYQLDFNAAGGPHGGGNTFTVNGTSYGVPSSTSWTADTYTFTATSSNETFTFAIDSSSADHTVGIDDITIESVPCYCLGTLLLTDRGDVAVEDLKIGDLLVTAAGEHRPIKWIGTRSFAGRFLAGNKTTLPICFPAHSLGENTPVRDLWVSPRHAIYLEGVLIPAEKLVDGVIVVQASRVERVDYFHIELESHDLLIAEGVAAESYLEWDNRSTFHNVAEYAALYPDAKGPERVCCAPLMERRTGSRGSPA